MNNITAIIKGMTIDEWKKGGFRGRLSLDNGKRKAFYGKTVSEVKNKAKKFLKDFDVSMLKSCDITLDSYVNYWLKTYKMNKIEPSSYTRLVDTYKHNIKEKLGDMTLDSIKTRDIQTLINSYANPIVGEKALSKSGLKKIKEVLNPCLKMAVEEGLISNNPCQNVLIPVESGLKVKTKQQFSLTSQELEIFKKACLERYSTVDEYKSRDAIVLLLILNSGLRVGEALALRWDNVNFETKTIRVKEILQSGIKYWDSDEVYEGKRYSRIKTSSKTISGERFIPMNDSIIFCLTELQEYDKRHKIKSDYVACTTVGTLNSPRNLRRSLDRLKERSGLNPRISLHTLRHTFGSTLLRKKIGIEIISKLMGHSNITITLNKYIHVIKEEEAKAMTLANVC